MKYFRDHFASYAVFLGTFILIFSFGMATVNMYNFSILNRGIERSDSTITAANELTLMLVDAETGQRGFIITDDDSFLDIFHYGTTNVPQQLAILTELTRGTSEVQLTSEINTLTFAKITELERTMDVRKKDGFDAARDVVEKQEGKQIMDDLRGKLALLIADEHSTMSAYRLSSDGFAHWAIIGLLFGIFSFLTLALTTIRIERRLPPAL